MNFVSSKVFSIDRDSLYLNESANIEILQWNIKVHGDGTTSWNLSVTRVSTSKMKSKIPKECADKGRKK